MALAFLSAFLTNGNYAVISPFWDSSEALDVGAVTLGDGNAGTTGEVSESNSVVGNSNNDQVGIGGVEPLTNGNFVIKSPMWDSDTETNVGAVTFVSGITNSLTISSANSLIGTTQGDQIGNSIIALTNGNYVVLSPTWDGEGSDRGAATFGNGTTGISGEITSANSLIGAEDNDLVGSGVALTNGNYVVAAAQWNGGGKGKGAVAFGNGTTGTSGVIGSGNALVGSQSGDSVGTQITPLENGNYVVSSPSWSDGATSLVGAVTFGNGTTGIAGEISSSNSLIGNSFKASIGQDVIALSNGNYIVNESSASFAGLPSAGAVAFGNGTSGLTGVLSANNALVGTNPGDQVGSSSVVESNTGNYFVLSENWNGRGAITLGNGTTGISGPVNDENSIVGSVTGDFLNMSGETLSDGNLVAKLPGYDNGSIQNAGAIAYLSGETGGLADLTSRSASVTSRQEHLGPINQSNSVIGAIANEGQNLNWDYDSNSGRLIVGQPAENQVTLFTLITRAKFDFDGDGRADIGVFRRNLGEWWYLRSSDGIDGAFAFGSPTDVAVPADFTCDGIYDFSFWRPSTGEWFVLRSDNTGFNSFPFGANGDIPAPGDFDGDNIADAAVFRPSSGTWFIQRSSDGVVDFVSFGSANDKPLVADYDNDGKG